MYAIIETGGKQYRVEEGEELLIERLPAVQPGERVEFDKVLLISDDGSVKVGTPYLEKTKVVGQIEEELKGKKITVFTYKPKKRYRRKLGHRQRYMRALIEEIQG
ncbi:MAG: 50S ribosomal protein L21 [Candidatus Bipolaricaulia bacterium]